MAGYAGYGYCASHSRFFWGLRLQLIATPSGLPVAYALTSAKTDERDTALAMLHLDPTLDRPGQVLMADKGYRSATFEAELADLGITLIRPSLASEKAEPTRPRTPRRPQTRRRLRPRPATTPRTDRRDLAQRNHRSRWPRPITPRLRPLTPLELSI